MLKNTKEDKRSQWWSSHNYILANKGLDKHIPPMLVVATTIYHSMTDKKEATTLLNDSGGNDSTNSPYHSEDKFSISDMLCQCVESINNSLEEART